MFIGDEKAEGMHIRLIDYDAEVLKDEELRDIESGAAAVRTETVSWININGLADIEKIRRLGGTFGLHPLLLEDVLNTGQRPKLEEFDNVIFVVLKMLQLDAASGEVRAEQLSMVIGRGFLITFQEHAGDVFDPVRNRIRNNQGRIRVSGVDYLAYSLLDTVVDHYIQIIERLGGKVEDLEVEVLESFEPKMLGEIHALKRELSFIRKSVRPAREAVLQLSKLDTDLIRPETGPFLKDLHDITTQATEAIETYREMLSDALSTYNGMVSNKMNDIMKVLTIFAAIFIPLTFIAGVYGTNFEYLPELHYRYGYFVFLGVLVAVGGGMLLFFKRRGWL